MQSDSNYAVCCSSGGAVNVTQPPGIPSTAFTYCIKPSHISMDTISTARCVYSSDVYDITHRHITRYAIRGRERIADLVFIDDAWFLGIGVDRSSGFTPVRHVQVLVLHFDIVRVDGQRQIGTTLTRILVYWSVACSVIVVTGLIDYQARLLARSPADRKWGVTERPTVSAIWVNGCRRTSSW